MFSKFYAQKYINFFAIALAFLLPLSRAGVSLFSILILLLFFFQKDLKSKFLEIKNQKVLIFIALFIIYNIISLSWVEKQNLTDAYSFIKSYWYLFIIYPLYLSLTKEYIDRVFIAFIAGILVSVVISYGMYFDIWQTGHNSSTYPAPFMHKIDFSMLLAFASLFLLIKAIYSNDKKLKILFISLFILTLIDLIIVSGRTGQMAFGLSIFVLIIFSFKNLKPLIITFVLFSFLIFISYNLLNGFKTRVDETFLNLTNTYKNQDYCTSSGMRIGAWIVSKDVIYKNPLFGIGQSDNTKIIPQIVDEKYPNMGCLKWFKDHHYHNQYIQILTAIGIVGLTLFLLIFYYLAKTKIINREIFAIKVSLISLMLTGFLTEPILNKQFTTALFALIVGIILSQKRVESS